MSSYDHTVCSHFVAIVGVFPPLTREIALKKFLTGLPCDPRDRTRRTQCGARPAGRNPQRQAHPTVQRRLIPFCGDGRRHVCEECARRDVGFGVTVRSGNLVASITTRFEPDSSFGVAEQPAFRSRAEKRIKLNHSRSDARSCHATLPGGTGTSLPLLRGPPSLRRQKDPADCTVMRPFLQRLRSTCGVMQLTQCFFRGATA
jgi:hypothetical protein